MATRRGIAVGTSGARTGASRSVAIITVGWIGIVAAAAAACARNVASPSARLHVKRLASWQCGPHIHQQRPYWPVRTAASRAGGQKVLETHCKVVHKGAGMPQQGLAAATGTQASADVTIAAAHAMAAWQTLQDPTSGAYYYFNTVTQQSSWTWPPAEQSAGAQQPQQLQDLGKVLGEQAAVWTAAMEGKAKPAAAPTDAGTIHTTQQAPGSAGDVEQWQQWRQQYQQWAQYAAMHANSGMTSAKDEKSESRSDAAQLALDPQIQAPPQPPAPAPQPEVANAEPPEANASASDSKQASATPVSYTHLTLPTKA